jgi:SAM-dependent methyltransferase
MDMKNMKLNFLFAIRKITNSNLLSNLKLLFDFEPYVILWRFFDRQTKTLLDIGCGKGNPISHLMMLSNAQFFRNIYKVGVDLYLPYLREAKARELYEDLIYGDVRHLSFRQKSFDTTLCLDLIEHLEKREGEYLLDEMEKITRKQIFVFTPVGFLPQMAYDTFLQIHRSSWKPSDFYARGYKVRGINGIFFLGERASFRFKGVLSIFSMILSHASQMLVYLFPKIAFQMLSIKNVENKKILGLI